MKKFFGYFGFLITVLNPLLAADASSTPGEGDRKKKPIMKTQISNDEMLNLLIAGNNLKQFNAVFAARFLKLRQKVYAELSQFGDGTQQNFTKLSLPLQVDISLFTTAKTKFVQLCIDRKKMLRSLTRDEEEMKQYLNTNK